MSLSILGTPHTAYFSTSTSGTTLSGTYAISAGSRRGAFVCVGRGSVGGDTNTWPTTMTYGGQTLSRVDRNYGWSKDEAEGAMYFADEADIAAMSDGNYSVSFVSSLAGGGDIGVVIIAVQDMDQSAGIADSTSSGENTGGSAISLTLTTTSGDLCFILGFMRGDAGTLSLGTGMTAQTAWASADDTAGQVDMRIDKITASGASTDAKMSSTNDYSVGAIAWAITEDTGGGGGSAISSDQTATPRGYARGNHRGTN